MKFLGDTHGREDFLSPNYFKQDMIQIGDCHLFGYDFAKYDSPRYFIDGNHDNFSKLNPDALIPYEIKGNLWYIPRGYIKDNILFIGGGDSIDRNQRIEGYEWYPEERLTYAQMVRALSHNVKVEIVVTHECPRMALEAMYSHVMNTGVSKDLNAIVEHYRPSLWFFGHHHKHYDFMLGDCRFVGLEEGEIFEI